MFQPASHHAVRHAARHDAVQHGPAHRCKPGRGAWARAREAPCQPPAGAFRPCGDAQGPVMKGTTSDLHGRRAPADCLQNLPTHGAPSQHPRAPALCLVSRAMGHSNARAMGHSPRHVGHAPRHHHAPPCAPPKHAPSKAGDTPSWRRRARPGGANWGVPQLWGAAQGRAVGPAAWLWGPVSQGGGGSSDWAAGGQYIRAP